MKYDASRQAPTMKMRSSGSPIAFSAREWRSTQPLQPLIWPARSFNSSWVASGTAGLLGRMVEPLQRLHRARKGLGGMFDSWFHRCPPVSWVVYPVRQPARARL